MLEIPESWTEYTRWKLKRWLHVFDGSFPKSDNHVYLTRKIGVRQPVNMPVSACHLAAESFGLFVSKEEAGEMWWVSSCNSRWPWLIELSWVMSLIFDQFPRPTVAFGPLKFGRRTFGLTSIRSNVFRSTVSVMNTLLTNLSSDSLGKHTDNYYGSRSGSIKIDISRPPDMTRLSTIKAINPIYGT